MKNKVKVGLIGLLIVFPVVFSMPIADASAELDARIWGSLKFLRTKGVGGIVVNYGDETAYDVEYSLIINGISNNIHLILNDFLGNISGVESNEVHSMVFGVMNALYAFGPIALTLTVTSSNADDVIETAMGLQIGFFTLIFKSWISFLLKEEKYI